MEAFPDSGGFPDSDGRVASRPGRPRGVNFKKIGELRDSTEVADIKKLSRTVQIFYKKDIRSVNEPFAKLPSEYLAIFSDRYRSDIWDDNVKSITIIGGDKAVYQEIFDWMLDSIHQYTPAAAPVPEYDESNPEIFRKYATLILAADYLQVPARDFADLIIKKTLFKLSREKFMSWDEVDFYIESFQGESDTDEKMREVLTNSIANAWWRRNFRQDDDDDDEDDYCILSVLREEHSQLDADLHNWCQKNEERIRGKWAEKDAQKAGGGGFGDASASGGGGDWDTPGATAGSGRGATSGDDSGATAVVGDWNTGGDGWASADATSPAPKATSGFEDSGLGWASDSQKENVAPEADNDSGFDTGAAPSMASLGRNNWDDGGHGGDWADEVNTDQQYAKTSW